MNNNLPDFLVIGAQRSGTTHLFKIMKMHPSICIASKKETFYFVRDEEYEKGIDYYRSLFSHCKQNVLKGELTPDYLFHETSAERIHKDLGSDIKLIAILRNPIDRAWSQYQRSVRNGKTISTFEKAILKHPKLLARGLYAQQLERYLKLFPKENILITFYDDMKEDIDGYLEKVFGFLGVDWSNEIKALVYDQTLDKSTNYGHAIRSRWLSANIYYTRKVKNITDLANSKHLDNFIDKLITKQKQFSKSLNLTNKRYSEMKPDTRLYLQRYFSEDLTKLISLTGRNLSHWK